MRKDSTRKSLSGILDLLDISIAVVADNTKTEIRESIKRALDL